MSVSKDLTTAVNKWTTSSSSKPYPKNSLVDSSLNPPGYIPGYVASQQVESHAKNEQQQQHLLSKRAH
ncbi:hypothetical protein Ddc_05757 [Ditylenchus destructor]|nr:hypothetical protein Ddc_05757 [Ditylenchus destructor]